jgi:translation initiation factor 3 subunit F
MFNLHRKVFPEETIVGWYSTGSQIYPSSHLLHAFYSREMNGPSPIHLLVSVSEPDEGSDEGSTSKKASLTNVEVGNDQRIPPNKRFLSRFI